MALSRLLPRLQPRPEPVPEDDPAGRAGRAVDGRAAPRRPCPAPAPLLHRPPSRARAR